jgi:hypothetical protein
MASNVQMNDETFTTLVAGIVSDTEALIKQEVALLKHDIRSDIRQTKTAAAFLVPGGVAVVMGVIILCLMWVHLFHWLVPTWPLWVCYGVAGAVVTALGAAAVYLGVSHLRRLSLLPEDAIQAMKENVQWTMKPTTFDSKCPSAGKR